MRATALPFGPTVPLFIVALLLPSGGLADAGFTGVGDLPGGAVSSSALGLSGDGRVVVGQSASSNGLEAFRFRIDPGIEGLGDLPGGGFESVATDASTDGSVIVGGGTAIATGYGFRWTEEEGMVGLGPAFPATTTGLAHATSGDGGLVVGDVFLDGFCDYTWTEATGVVDSCTQVFAEQVDNLGVSAGGTVVGSTFNLDGNFDTWAHRDLQTVPVVGNPFVGILRAVLYGANADGSVLVGQGIDVFDVAPTFALRWEGGVETSLGTLGGALSLARDVSADGAVVVGWADTATGREAFVWDAVSGMRSLKDELEGVYGLDLTGWVLDEARAVSDDGNVVVGTGTNPLGDPEGWVAVFETACSNGLDDDGDGTTDGDDFGCDDASDLSERTPVVACDDGLDNDLDGWVDFGADPGCKGALFDLEAPVCQNGLDDDGDARIDFDGGAAANGGVPLAPADPQCDVAWRPSEAPGSTCGLGGGAVLAGLGLALRRGLGRRRRSTA